MGVPWKPGAVSKAGLNEVPGLECGLLRTVKDPDRRLQQRKESLSAISASDEQTCLIEQTENKSIKNKLLAVQ